MIMELVKIVNYTKVNAITWDVAVVYLKDKEFETLVIHTTLVDDELTFEAAGYEPYEIDMLTNEIGNYLAMNGQLVCESVGFDSYFIYHLPITHHYRIFQLSHNDLGLFAPLKDAADVDFGKYVCVWHEETNHEINQRDLDRIYTKFNVDHPYNFGGHSISVSDIIEVFDADGDFNKSNFRYFYCDSIGWAELPIKR